MERNPRNGPRAARGGRESPDRDPEVIPPMVQTIRISRGIVSRENLFSYPPSGSQDKPGRAQNRHVRGSTPKCSRISRPKASRSM